MLSVKALSKQYAHLEVVKHVSLEVARGEIVTITGASGAGKSTLLHIIGTLDKPDSGEIIIENKVVNTLPPKALAQFRNTRIGFVFQFHHLLPEFTALENVMMPALIAGERNAKAREEAIKLLKLLGLGMRTEHKPGALSGGEQQRVAIARALINQPAIVLADEPTGNLDSHNAQDIHELFFRLRNELNQTFLIVTHNEKLAQMADRELIMKDGEIIQTVTKQAVIQ